MSFTRVNEGILSTYRVNLKKMNKVFYVVAIILTIIGLLFGIEAAIKWTIYLGMPLIIFAGSAGVAFVTKRLEAIIIGAVIAALWPVLFEALKSAF